MPEIIKIGVQKQSREQEFLLCLIKELRLETATVWRDYSGKIHLQLKKRLKLGTTVSTSVSHVKSAVTISVRVSFPWNQSLTEESVLAQVLTAVADHPLLETTDHDIASDEWLHLQEELQELLDDHKLFKCQGLLNLGACNDCEALYGNGGKGATLALKLARLDSEYKEALEDDDDEFDPRAFVSSG